MERIVIEVDNITAKKWRYTSPEAKQRLSKKIELILKSIMDKGDDDLWPFLEKLRKEADKEGFNDDILNQILSEK